jgi:hypothetical protein
MSGTGALRFDGIVKSFGGTQQGNRAKECVTNV